MDNIIRTEREYRELERLANKLGVPLPPKVMIKLESTLNGKLIDRFEGPAHSWVRNFYNSLFSTCIGYTLAGATYGEGYMTNKTYNASVGNYAAFPTVAGAGDAVGGIVVGTGSGAESFESYDLSARVAHGASAGQLSYTAQNATTIAYTSGTKTWEATLLRIFNNNSGGSIIITEVGIMSQIGDALACRDLLGSSVTVANGGQLTVTYTISKVFPA